ncbi:MAG: ABC-three component system middle component 8 [Verrucomicrobiota bacterium]
MLRPTKHSHPDRTVINVSLQIMLYLQKNRVCDYSKLLAFSKKRVIGGDVLFLPALNFLYLLGLIEYLPKADTIEYRGSSK